MAHGFKSGGRVAGISKNKRTKETEQAAAVAAEKIAGALGEAAFDGDAHALLMAVYKDCNQPLAARIEAAGKAIKFEKPALASIESKNETLHRYVARVPVKAASSQAWQEQQQPPEPKPPLTQ